jgi:flagellar biosynthesis protein FliP
MKKIITVFFGLTVYLMLFSDNVSAASLSIPALSVSNTSGGQTYSVSLQILGFMTLLTLLPGLLMAMTAFTRIIIVFAILRQALGLSQTPTNQILVGISLFLTYFIMAPVFTNINDNALQPYLNDKINVTQAFSKAQKPIRNFMLNQTRNNDLELFSQLSNKKYKTLNEVPLYVVIPAFITSELKTAFQIGFIIFLPFLIIDLVVASVLMAMGMMMLSPLIISLPFKVMLFVMVDGWTLIIGTLASSFAL